MNGLNFKYLLVFLPLLFAMACTPNDLEVGEPVPFEEREILQVLENEPGTIGYFCDGYKIYTYFKVHDENIPNLLPSDSSFISKVFFEEPYGYDANFDKEKCEPGMRLQSFNFPVLISGNLLKSDVNDDLPEFLKPILLTNIDKPHCPIDSVNRSDVALGLFGEWKIHKILLKDSINYPPCEFSEMTLTFSEEAVGEEADSTIYQLHYDVQQNYCGLSFRVRSENQLRIYGGSCILGAIPATTALWQFGIDYYRFFDLYSNGKSDLKYNLKDNWLILTNPNNDRLELFRGN